MTLQDYFIDNVQLKNEWAFNRNSITPESVSPYARTKVWWRCVKGHEWQASLDSRVSLGRSCPYCTNQAIAPGENDMATAAPQMAKLWHPTLNGDLKPTDIASGSSKRIWWQCEQGHSWKAPAYSIKAGSACPYCAGKKAIPGQTDLATTHPHVLPQWSEKNKLSPTEVTAGSHKKVLWICSKGHQWEAVVNSVVIEGCGCPYCAGKRAIPGETDLATLRPDILEQWDYGKNDIQPDEILPSSHDKVWWKCEKGHSWQAMVFSRTRENAAGCPYCTGRLVLRGFNDLATLKPKVAEEWYFDLNGDLRPEDVSLGSNKKVWWRCKDGHVWRAAVYSRTRKKGTGCPACAGTVKQKEPTKRKTMHGTVRSGAPVRLK